MNMVHEHCSYTCNAAHHHDVIKNIYKKEKKKMLLKFQRVRVRDFTSIKCGYGIRSNNFDNVYKVYFM